MSPFLEFEGKSVEKAVDKACDELNIPKEKLDHDVVSYGSTGIFGLVGTKRARIRVTVPESAPEDVPEKPETASREKDRSHVPVPETAHTSISPVADDPDVQASPSELVHLGEKTLLRIIDFITTDAKITVEEGQDRIMFNVQGGNPAVLIGKRGQTLEAIQYLVEKIVNKQSRERIRIQIDVEGYLANRKANLRRLAGRLAEKAKRTGKPTTIGQINSHDRRIVHLTLKDDGDVRTQ
ncbi:MAG: Jag N-terminal domain-containing protein, partial [Deltaproteobacteria bacterium]|nr:Jag N-terminal domain-containing protein [Deltaproteobacteria bacterium]